MKAGISSVALLLGCFALSSTFTLRADPQSSFYPVAQSAVLAESEYGKAGSEFLPNGLMVSWGQNSLFILDKQLNILHVGVGGRDLEVGPDGLLYRLAGGQIEVLTTNLTIIRGFGVSTGGGRIGFAISTNGLVYVSNTESSIVSVYTTNGVFVRQWGSLGAILPGQFESPTDVEIGTDGLVYVQDSSRTQVFDEVGNYIRTATEIGGSNGRRCLTQNSDGLWENGYSGYSSDGMSKATWVYYDYGARIILQRRGYRTAGNNPPNAIPLPFISSVAQRTGTTLVDVNYKVIDGNDARVNTAAVAFLAGQTGLNALVPIRTLVEGTAANLGTNTPTGTNLVLTWNAAADWSTNFANTEIEVLAKDNRGLLDIHFITIPTNASQPAVTISRKAFEHSDFLNAWVWLVASGNTNVALTNGNVVGMSAPYTGLALTTANGTTTTTDGRNYLYGLLNVRASTSNEVSRAQSGNFGYEGGTFPVAPLP